MKALTKLDTVLGRRSLLSLPAKERVKELFREIIRTTSRDYDGVKVCPTKSLLDKVDEL